MNFWQAQKIFGLFLLLLAGLLPLPLQADSEPSYSALFTEEVLTVTKERDGLLPGTLRTALIQASGIRANNSFNLVRIVFAPEIRRVQITKGPLPVWDGSLLTLDCSVSAGRAVIEYQPRPDDAGQDPSVEPSVLVLKSNNNLIRNCHLTGAPGHGIRIEGNHNIIEHSAVGYHQDIPETKVPPSALYGAPETNGKAGIYLGEGANENEIRHNDIVANTFHGVLLDRGVGTANRIEFNYFTKNSGEAIKSIPGTPVTPPPSIQEIRQEGDSFIISGKVITRADVQIYMLGKNTDEIGMLVAEAPGPSPLARGQFEIVTKSKGFVLGETQLVAQAHGYNRNSSEFSRPILIGTPEAPAEAAPSVPVAEAEENPAPENEGLEAAPNEEMDDPVEESEDLPQPIISRNRPGETEDYQEDTESHDSHESTGTDFGQNLGSQLPPPQEKPTVIRLNGQGDGGGPPDSGTDQQNDVTSMGI